MGILTFWMMCRIKNTLEDKLEQIRLNQLTPAQHAAEAAAEVKESIARAVLVILLGSVFAFAAIHGV